MQHFVKRFAKLKAYIKNAGNRERGKFLADALHCLCLPGMKLVQDCHFTLLLAFIALQIFNRLIALYFFQKSAVSHQ